MDSRQPDTAERRPAGSVLRAALADELAAAAVALRDMVAGAHLDISIDRQTHTLPIASARAVRNMAYDATRQYGLLAWLGKRLNHREPAPVLAALQAMGMAQLLDARRPVPIIIDQAVRAVGRLPDGAAHPGAVGFINATLRRFARERHALMAVPLPDEARYNHPAWWVARVRELWPDSWEDVLAMSVRRAPLSLRANARLGGQQAAGARLLKAGVGYRCLGQDGLVLDQAVPVEQIPGFAEGLLSVQDLGAQCAARLLDPQPGERILDACAAPGGKTAHLLEIADCDVLALDIDPDRASIILNNLQRGGLPVLSADRAGPAAVGWGAQVLAADAANPEQWWDGRPFDRILLDAPCSASGIVRRHPDVLWHRKRRDIATFSVTQTRLLDKLWPLLRPGGTLLYATCSIFPEEGEMVVSAFASRQADCFWQRDRRPPGWDDWPENGQLLPRSDELHEHDGFFYALLSKYR
ncbi:MAG: 16S rRNA (cytosine(967)-C(5))-methyltransferase RsmB [Lautropia sp.]|nr:16S rRNA (cytosine(967)-C(5))-methyltransferase RsmB [Lautropia sp.]